MAGHQGVSHWTGKFNKSSGKVWLEVWYDPRQGYFPVQAREYTREGKLYGESHVEMTEVKVGGKSLFFPLHGLVERFEDGKSSFRREMRLDVASLRMNHDLPGEQFVLKLTPNDYLFDNDHEVWLIRPAEDPPAATQEQ